MKLPCRPYAPNGLTLHAATQPFWHNWFRCETQVWLPPIRHLPRKTDSSDSKRTESSRSIITSLTKRM
jgi:hypothetical protein